MTTSVEVRGEIVTKLRRDLVGPSPGADEADIAAETLEAVPSRWYLAGFLAPEQALPANDAAEDEERETDAEAQEDMLGAAEAGGAARADGDPPPEAPTTARRLTPPSIALTVLVPDHVREIKAQVSWGDYRTEPPLPKEILVPSDDEEKESGK